MVELYPPIEPYDQGMLAVGEGTLVYWETCGNRTASWPWWCTAGRDRGARRGCAEVSIRTATGSCYSISAGADAVPGTRVIPPRT